MEFREKRVLVLVRSRPFGKIHNFEGWRAAVGMFGMDHIPTLLFMGDGVYVLLRGIDESPIRMFKSTYEGFEGTIYASMRSLRDRKIDPSELSDGVRLADDKQVASLLCESDIVMTF
ncbi:MAG: DsrE family protein [Candidatus Thorarchaeota archaeon]